MNIMNFKSGHIPDADYFSSDKDLLRFVMAQVNAHGYDYYDILSGIYRPPKGLWPWPEKSNRSVTCSSSSASSASSASSNTSSTTSSNTTTAKRGIVASSAAVSVIKDVSSREHSPSVSLDASYTSAPQTGPSNASSATSSPDYENDYVNEASIANVEGTRDVTTGRDKTVGDEDGSMGYKLGKVPSRVEPLYKATDPELEINRLAPGFAYSPGHTNENDNENDNDKDIGHEAGDWTGAGDATQKRTTRALRLATRRAKAKLDKSVDCDEPSELQNLILTNNFSKVFEYLTM